MGWDIDPRIHMREMLEEEPENLLRKLGLIALTSLVLKTPVDTGRLRGGWFVYEGELLGQIETQPAPDKQGSATISKGKSQINEFEVGGVLIIQDNVEYGIYVNDGSPTIEPNRMLERTLEEIEGIFGVE